MKNHDGIETTQITDDTYLLSGAGANIVAQIGEQDVILVDAGDAAHVDEVLAAVRDLTDAQIRYVFDTSADPDHADGNRVLAKAGQALGQSMGGPFGVRGGAVVMAALPATTALQQKYEDSDAWPTQNVDGRAVLYLNNQSIEVTAKPGAHSDGDAIVLLRGSDVLVTGEIFDITRFPVIDTDHGGTIQGEIDALNDLIDIAVPNVPMPWLPGGTIVIPAHGRICQQADLVQYRDMVTIIRDRIKDLKSKGKSLKETIEADPTAGYTERYSVGTDTAAKFIEAIYKSLPATEKKS